MHPLPDRFPSPRATGPGGVPSLRWGIVGAGTIARFFTSGVRARSTQRVQGVASRRAEDAHAFAAAHGIPAAFDTVGALLASPDVDAVYIATPQHLHEEHALAAIAAGKHVLVEKPFALSAAQAERMASAARAAGVFAMEAMWSLYLPHMDVIRQILQDGWIGDIRHVIADHSQGIPAGTRFDDPARGGGALLDLGVYPLTLAHHLLGAPRSVLAHGVVGPTGVDLSSTVLLDYDGPATATVTTGMDGKGHLGATIIGSTGTIDMAGPFFFPTTFRVGPSALGVPWKEWADPSGPRALEGLGVEAEAFAGFVGAGLTESPVHDLSATIAVLRTLDDCRRQLGVTVVS